MGGMEAHAHGNGHGGHGDAGVLGKTLGNGAQQNKGGITEHRNGNKVAGDGKAKSGMLLAGDLQNGLGHGFRRAGFFQQRAGHGAQRNDQADVRHGAAHAAGECREHVLHAHAGDQRKGHGGGDQCEEGVNFQFDRAQNQHRHGTNQSKDHKCSGCHILHSFLFGNSVPLGTGPELSSDGWPDTAPILRRAPDGHRWPRRSARCLPAHLRSGPVPRSSGGNPPV